MSGWLMALLVGFLFFALAILAVLVIWLWHEPQGQQQPSQLPQRQTPKIVIRPRRFRTKEIVEQSRVPPPMPRPGPPPTRTPTTTPPPVTRPTATTPTPTRPPATRATPPAATPTPPPAQRMTPVPVVTITNGPVIGNTRFKVDFDTVHKRTGQEVRNCRCRECRELRADAGI
jgi:hypothetical protein